MTGAVFAMLASAVGLGGIMLFTIVVNRSGGLSVVEIMIALIGLGVVVVLVVAGLLAARKDAAHRARQKALRRNGRI